MAKNKLSEYNQTELDFQLQAAAEQNDDEEIRRLIQAGANMENSYSSEIWGIRGEQGTPLTIAAVNNNKEAAIALIELGADLHARSTKDKNTPLHFSIYNSNKDTTDVLLAAGAKLHLKDDAGRKPGDISSAHLNAYISSFERKDAKRPTPDEVGLDMNKRNAALAAMGSADEKDMSEIKADVGQLPPTTTITSEEIIRRQQQQAIENDEGI